MNSEVSTFAGDTKLLGMVKKMTVRRCKRTAPNSLNGQTKWQIKLNANEHKARKEYVHSI